MKTDSVSLNLNQIVSYFTMFVPVFGILYLLIILPEDTLSVGELVAVYSLMGTYYSSAISFFTLFLNTSTYKSSLEYLNDFLDEESQKKTNTSIRKSSNCLHLRTFHSLIMHQQIIF